MDYCELLEKYKLLQSENELIRAEIAYLLEGEVRGKAPGTGTAFFKAKAYSTNL
jgi:hypothetical protein